MKTYSIRYSADAYEDLRGLYSYIAEELHAPEYALGQVERIKKSIAGLKELPYKHEEAVFRSASLAGIRKMPVDRFVVFYSVEEDDDTVRVIRILYAGRRIDDELFS